MIALTRDTAIGRRRFLKASGALTIPFSLGMGSLFGAAASAQTRPLPEYAVIGDYIKLTPNIDSWLRIDSEGDVTVLTSRVELGHGVITALGQMVAEELDVAFERVTLVSGDTARVPDQGPTTASDTVGKAGQMLRLVAAEARLALMEMAADKLGSPIESLAVSDGVIRVKGDELKEVTYAQLLNGKSIERQITGKAPVKRAQDGKYLVVGQSIPRVDLPNKLTAGQDDFLENMRLPGMVHARTVRAPMYGAAVDRLNADGVKQMAGVIAVVHMKYPGHPGLDRAELLDIPPGDVVAVVAEREEIAVRAADRLAREVSWKPGETLPTDTERLHQWMTDAPAEDAVKTGIGHRFIEARFTAAEKRLEAVYTGPYQSPAPISPICAVADVKKDEAVIWSGAQGPFGSRWSAAKALGLAPEAVRIRCMATSGMFGRRSAGMNVADTEAALISQEIGKPVRLVWTRQQEFQWGPYRPPHVVSLAGALDGGMVVGVKADVRFVTRANNPISAISMNGLEGPYSFGARTIHTHLIEGTVRTTFIRNVYRLHNAFAMESFVDELAMVADVDPVDFRLRHLSDPRARAVIEAAADHVDWKNRKKREGEGWGIAFNAYDSVPAAGYAAHVAQVEVDRETGNIRVKKIIAVIDAGLVVNPDGLRNQMEGGAIQAASWALKEQLLFAKDGLISRDWATYPILRFPEVPEVECVVIDRKDKPSVSVGEPVTTSVAPAIANAIHDAIGARLRDMPFTAERIKSAAKKSI